MAKVCLICDNSSLQFIECSITNQHSVCCVCAAKHNFKCAFCRNPLIEKTIELTTKELSKYSIECFDNGLASSGGEVLIKTNDKLSKVLATSNELINILKEENKNLKHLLKEAEDRNQITPTLVEIEISRLRRQLSRSYRENKHLEQIIHSLIHPIKGEKGKMCRYYNAKKK